jgi:hypothetical protein
MTAMSSEYSPMEIGRLSDCLAGLTRKIERVERTIQGLEAMHKSADEMLGVDWVMFSRHEKNFVRGLRWRRQMVMERLKKAKETKPLKESKRDSQREVMSLLRDFPGFVTKLLDAKEERHAKRPTECECLWWNVSRGCVWDATLSVKTDAEAQRHYLKAYWLTACLNNLERLIDGLGVDCPRLFADTLADGKDLLWLIMSGKDEKGEDDTAHKSTMTEEVCV